MPRLLKRWPRGRQAQSGATLVEVLVSVAIMGLALALIVGTFSTGLLQSVMAKRNAAAGAVVQYELDQISGGVYDTTPQAYSDCFATENATSPPVPAAGFKDDCASSSYVLRADVSVQPGPSPTSQLWSVSVVSWPSEGPVGKPVQIIKVNR